MTEKEVFSSENVIPNVATEGKKSANVPNLRFPQYTTNWAKKRLSTVVTMSKGYGITKEQLTENGHPCILYGELYTTYKNEVITSVKSKTDIPQKGLVLSKANDVIIPSSGETPEDIATACCVMLDNILLGGDLNILRPNNHSGSFISYQLNGRRKYDIAKVAQGASIVHLHNEHLAKIDVYTPESIGEEEKIVNLLTLIDQRINTQSKIIEKLQSQMKAIYHNIFANCEDNNVVPLRSICSIKKGTQLNGTELFDSGNFYVMNGGITPSGYYNQYNIEKNTISISEGGNSCGYIQYNKERFWSGGHCYTLDNLSSNIISKYLYHFLKAHEEEIMRMRIGTGLPNIQKKDLESFGVYVPEIDRQAQILSLLDCFEEKIVVEKELLEKLREQKKYLLSNMFI